MESTLDISALLVAVENLITVPGRMSTEINLFGAGEIQYGSEKEIKERQQELNEITRGKADLLTTIVAVESIKDSKAAQKLKNKFSPNEIPNLTIEAGASKVGKVKIGQEGQAISSTSQELPKNNSNLTHKGQLAPDNLGANSPAAKGGIGQQQAPPVSKTSDIKDKTGISKGVVDSTQKVA